MPHGERAGSLSLSRFTPPINTDRRLGDILQAFFVAVRETRLSRISSKGKQIGKIADREGYPVS